MKQKQKRKRAPGGGRKPSGPFVKNAAQLTMRMPSDMRAQLEAAAQKRGWSLTQETLRRLQASLNKERTDRFDAATHALCFLISSVAESVNFSLKPEWHRDPFLFRAFKLAVAKLLDTLEPAGEMKFPLRNAESPEEIKFQARLAEMFKAPETLANVAASHTLRSLFHPMHPRPLAELRAMAAEEGDVFDFDLVETVQRHLYGILDVRRDLGIDETKSGGETT